MKNKLLQFGIIAVACFICTSLLAQNADELIDNQYLQSYNYVGGSFVIDTGQSLVQNQKRAFLIWASNIKKDTSQRYLSLSEFGTAGNFLSQKATPAHTNASLKTLFPKKVIRSKFKHVYYVLGYVVNSSHFLNNLRVYSTPVIYKIDGNTLNQIWATRISLPSITANNTQAVIEYNDMIETKDGNIVVVGKYARNSSQKEYVLATKIAGATGALIWRNYYQFGNGCNEGANAVAETTDTKLSLTGYVSRCTGASFGGPADMFYTQLTPGGAAIAGTYKRYPWLSNLSIWADNISCYTSNPGSDQLVISGYVDIPVGNSFNRQILIANLKQNGNPISLHHIGDSLQDVARDLIFQPIAGTQDYNLFLTGLTSNYNSASTVFNEAYFLSLKFNAGAGVTGVNELSVFPVSTAPFNTYSGRTGVEIKNADSYKRFAILATGNYKPTNTTQTYTDILVRDFADANGACIKKYQPPLRPFTIQPRDSGAATLKISLNKYNEDWITLDRLLVKQLCQQVKIDPYKALPGAAQTASFTAAMNNNSGLIITPNPVKQAFVLSTANNESLTGKGGKAMLYIYNASMQLVQAIAITSNQATISVAANSLKPGWYIVQLSGGDAIRTAKFLKE